MDKVVMDPADSLVENLGQLPVEALLDLLLNLDRELDTGDTGVHQFSFDVPLRNRVIGAAGELTETEFDGDRMLSRRLLLVVGFAFPRFASSPSYRLAEEIREVIAEGADHDGELFAAMFDLIDALPHFDPESVGEFANSKLRLDTWIEDLLQVAESIPFLTQQYVQEFGDTARAIRRRDPMTKSGSVFAKQIAEANAANEAAAKALRSARETAVSEAEGRLSKYFADAATKDGRIGGVLATAAIGALGGSFGFGYNLLGDLESITWGAELAKLALTLPLLAVSVYLGRLSSHYRDAARWAKSASVQLNTIDAFIQGIENAEARDEMRMQLGRRVFGDPGLGGDGKNPDTPDATALLDSVSNFMKNARGQ